MSRVAVVGAGVSGLTAAYLLRERHDVVLFEADDRLGGHAHTHDITAGGSEVAVDTGFIVLNDRTYPHLQSLFADLGVDIRPTEMSMSISCSGCGLEYAGGRGAPGILAQRRRALDPRFLRLLWQIRRFQRAAHALLESPESEGRTGDEPTFGEFLDAHGFGDHFVAHYAVPVVACVWSTGHADALAYPARYLFRFLDHHGFLSLGDAPQWYTVTGGSRTYVDRLVARLDDVRTSTGVTSVRREPDGVVLTDATGDETRVDTVVIATHADQALGLLADPTDDERRVLGAFRYSRNEVVLHRDLDALPRTPAARASWNYRMPACGHVSETTDVSYWMNRLQGHDESSPLIVSLNAPDVPSDPSDVLARVTYDHPVYTPESVAAQRGLDGLATAATVYAGAYHGWGFHEDGCRSGVEAARHVDDLAARTTA